MPSHLSSLGFSINSEREFNDLMGLAARNATEFRVQDGLYLRWRCPSGVELWVQANKAGDLIGMNPHFDARPTLVVGCIGRELRGNVTVLDGAFYAWASPDGDVDNGAYPFVFDCPDFQRYDGLSLPSIQTARITAFARELDVHVSREAYYSTRGDGPRIPEKFFIPSGLFTPDCESTEIPSAHAIFTGRVLSSAELVNTLTGLPFVALEVETYGGTYGVVVDAGLVAQVPAPDSIISGSFWLSGRFIESPAD